LKNLKQIKQQFQNEELTPKHLVAMMAKYRPYLHKRIGIELIHRAKRILLKFLDDAAKLSALGVSKAENSAGAVDASKDIASLSEIDILGFTRAMAKIPLTI
jgi:hypothetical protein